MKHQHAPKLQDRDPLDQSQSRGYQDKDAALELTPSQELALRMVDTYQKNAQNERADFGEHARRTGDMAHVFARHDLPRRQLTLPISTIYMVVRLVMISTSQR